MFEPRCGICKSEKRALIERRLDELREYVSACKWSYLAKELSKIEPMKPFTVMRHVQKNHFQLTDVKGLRKEIMKKEDGMRLIGELIGEVAGKKAKEIFEHPEEATPDQVFRWFKDLVTLKQNQEKLDIMREQGEKKLEIDDKLASHYIYGDIVDSKDNPNSIR